MKRRLLLLLAFIVMASVAPSLSSAQSNTAGINLAWNECSTFGAANKTFACASNAGSNQLFVSFVPMGGLDNLVGMACTIDIVTDQAVLPNWWHLEAGGCRVGVPPNVSANFNFLSNVNCADPWGGAGAGGIAAKWNDGQQLTDVRRVRLNVVCAIAGPTAVDSTLEYYAAVVAINNKASTGAGSCAGCSFPACIRLGSIQLARPAIGGIPQDLYLFSPPPGGGSQQVTWQGGVGVDCNLVPTRNRTWGEIKSLYR